jgi:hypothetical protein
MEAELITGGPNRVPQVTVLPVGELASVLIEHERTTVTRTASEADRLSAVIGLVNVASVSTATTSAQVRPEGPTPNGRQRLDRDRIGYCRIGMP